MKDKMDYRLWCWMFFVLFLIMFFASAFLAKAWGDALDELWVTRNALEESDELLWDCMRVRDFYKSDLDQAESDLVFCENQLEAIPAYCSAGLYQVTIDGLRARVNYLEEQVNSCTRAYMRKSPSTICSWDMCGCAFPDGWSDRELCDDTGITPFYVAQALCVYDENCSNCLEMTDGRVEWCFRNAYYP